MYKNSTNSTPLANPLSAAIRQEMEAHVSALIPAVKDAVLEAVSSAIAPLIKESGIPSGKLTRTEFCRQYAVSLSTLCNLIDAGVLHPQRIGRRVLIDAAEADEKFRNGQLAKYRHRKN